MSVSCFGRVDASASTTIAFEFVVVQVAGGSRGPKGAIRGPTGTYVTPKIVHFELLVSPSGVFMQQAGPIPFKWALTVLRDISRALLAAYQHRIVQMVMNDVIVMVDDALLCWRRDHPGVPVPSWCVRLSPMCSTGVTVLSRLSCLSLLSLPLLRVGGGGAVCGPVAPSSPSTPPVWARCYPCCARAATRAVCLLLPVLCACCYPCCVRAATRAVCLLLPVLCARCYPCCVRAFASC